MPEVRAELWAFIRAFGARWFIYMSGAPSVPIAVAAFFVENAAARIGLGATAFACMFLAAFFVWRMEHVARIEAESKLLKRGIELTLHGRSIDGNAPLGVFRYVILLAIKNTQVSRSPNAALTGDMGETMRYIRAVYARHFEFS